MLLPTPLPALDAFASGGLEKNVEIFPPIVVGDFLARLYLLDRAQDHLALDHVGFGVWPARMVGVTRDVAAARSVHGRALVDLEHVAAAARLQQLRLRRGDAATLVLDDECALLDQCGREQPEPGLRATDAIKFLAITLLRSPVRHCGRSCYAAFSAAGRVTSSRVSTGTGSRSVLMPGQPSNDRRSTSLSFSSGASLTTLIEIVTFWNADLGAPAIMCPRTSKSVRATASKLS